MVINFIEFLLLTVWCGLGFLNFWNKGCIGLSNLIGVYAVSWFGFAYIVFELGKSPFRYLSDQNRPMLYLFLVLSYWPIEYLFKLIYRRLKRRTLC
jgi:hypothetical protein